MRCKQSYFSYGIEQRLNRTRNRSESPANLSEAGKLGHFLKGSSAAIGVIRVRDSCEKIQHWGALKDPITAAPVAAEEAEKLITSHLKEARAGFSEAKQLLKRVHTFFVYFVLCSIAHSGADETVLWHSRWRRGSITRRGRA